MAQQKALLIGGTGYQYGDTDFLEYSERLYLDIARGCAREPASDATPRWRSVSADAGQAGLPGEPEHPPGHRPEGGAGGDALRTADDRVRRARAQRASRTAPRRVATTRAPSVTAGQTLGLLNRRPGGGPPLDRRPSVRHTKVSPETRSWTPTLTWREGPTVSPSSRACRPCPSRSPSTSPVADPDPCCAGSGSGAGPTRTHGSAPADRCPADRGRDAQRHLQSPPSSSRRGWRRPTTSVRWARADPPR